MGAVDDLLSQVEGDEPRHTVSVLARPSLWYQLQEAEQQVNAANDEVQRLERRRGSDDQEVTLGDDRSALQEARDWAAEAQERFDRLREEAAASVAEIVCRPLSAPELRKLKTAHPPDREQRARREDVDRDGFDPALLAASAVDPQMTVEEARRLLDGLPAQAGDQLVRDVRRLSEVGADPSRLAATSPTRT